MIFPTKIPRLPGHSFCIQELTFLEFFAGEGNTWKAMRADSINAIGVDITYAEVHPGEQHIFDILSNAGFSCGTKLIYLDLLNPLDYITLTFHFVVVCGCVFISCKISDRLV